MERGPSGDPGPTATRRALGEFRRACVPAIARHQATEAWIALAFQLRTRDAIFDPAQVSNNKLPLLNASVYILFHLLRS